MTAKQIANQAFCSLAIFGFIQWVSGQKSQRCRPRYFPVLEAGRDRSLWTLFGQGTIV